MYPKILPLIHARTNFCLWYQPSIFTWFYLLWAGTSFLGPTRHGVKYMYLDLSTTFGVLGLVLVLGVQKSKVLGLVLAPKVLAKFKYIASTHQVLNYFLIIVIWLMSLDY